MFSDEPSVRVVCVPSKELLSNEPRMGVKTVRGTNELYRDHCRIMFCLNIALCGILLASGTCQIVTCDGDILGALTIVFALLGTATVTTMNNWDSVSQYAYGSKYR